MAVKRNNIKDFFRVIKIAIPIITIVSIVSMIFAWYGIDIKVHALFGHSFFIDVMALVVTYTDAGKLYFTAKFRALIYVLLLISILEYSRCLFEYDIYVFYNISLSIPPIAIMLAIITKIRSNEKRDKDIAKPTNKSN